MGFEFKISGDLKKEAERIAAIGDPKSVLKKASSDMCEETLNLISEGFSSGSDPYGKSWDAPNNLQITGHLRAYAKGEVDSGGFEVHATDPKAIWHHDSQWRDTAPYHKKGTAPLRWKLPTRRQVPVEGRPLPDEWKERLTECLEDAITALK